MNQQTKDFTGAPKAGRGVQAGAARRERPLALRRARRLALPWMALGSIVLAVALFEVASVFWSDSAAPPAAARSAAPERAAPPARSRSVAAPVTESRLPESGRGKLVHKCLQAGATTFSDKPCAPGTETGQVVPADPDQNVSEGLLRSQIELSRAPAAGAPRSGASQGDAGSLEKYQCDALAAQVKAIDQQVGQPMPPTQKERLVALRRDYRDAQFRKGC